MAPRKRALFNNSTAQNASTSGAGPAAGAHRSSARRPRSDDDDEDDNTQTFNIVAACMSYSAKTEQENKDKANRWLNDSKKTGADYEKKVKALILEEQREVKALYDEYRTQSEKDMQEKEKILKQIAKNLAAMEELLDAQMRKSTTVEKERYLNTLSVLKEAENNRAASAEEVALALEAKRREVNDRTQTGTGITSKKSAIQSRL